MTISRRTAFMAGAGVLATGLIGGGGLTSWGGRAHRIKIAGGSPGGVYQIFADRLAGDVNAAGRRLYCEPVPTEGSVENIELIGEGEAQIGIAQADASLAAFAGKSPFTSAVPLRAIGRVYHDYLQIVVPRDARLDDVDDLGGRKVWIGTRRSGTHMFGTLLFDLLAELKGLDVDRQEQPLKEAVSALERGEIDAMQCLGGMPVAALEDLHNRIKIRLLPTGDLLPHLRSRYGTVYRKAIIPAASYGRAGMVTVGVPNLLVCLDTLADDIVATLTRVLIERATQLVPPRAQGTQFGDRRSLINTLDVPLHPSAASVYRRHHG